MTNLSNSPSQNDRQFSRRRWLQVAGLGSATSALAVMVAHQPAAAVPQSAADTSLKRFATIAELLDHVPEDADTALVAGFHAPGDGAPKTLRWFADSDATANGGTVLSRGSGSGRWHQLHDGTLDFRHFGIFDASEAADDALEAMVNDPSVQRIEAHSDLNFTRRHTFFRSNLTLDFGGHLITAEGIEPNTKAIREYGAVLGFEGRRGEQTQTVTLTQTMPELTDVYEVNDAGFFTQGGWYEVISDLPPGGFSYSADQELQRMVQVTEIVSSTRIRVNYKNGWELAAGRKTNWTPVEPVERIRVENMRFRGPGGDADTGAHPLAFLYGVHCDIDRIHSSRSYWSLCMRGYCTYFTTTRCTLNDPIDAAAGGAGYLTQQMYSLYGRVADCHTSRARHLVDFTACAYSIVENCHGDGDFMGPFVTHGQYEHDLTYIGNSGMMTFANSGQKWGSWIKRVTVRKHVGPLFFSGRKGPTIAVKCVDLTLEDVEIIRDPDMFAQPSGYQAWGWVNADGLQMRGCRVDDSFHIYQNSEVSKRPTIIEDTHIGNAQSYAGLPFIDASVTTPLRFIRSHIVNINSQMTVNSSAPLEFDGCVLAAADPGFSWSLPSALITLNSCSISDLGVSANGTAEQEVRVLGSSQFSGTPPVDGFLSRGGDSLINWTLDGYRGQVDSNRPHVSITTGQNNYRAVGAQFRGGGIALDTQSHDTLMHVSNVEVGVSRAAGFPETGDRHLVEGNLVL